MAETVIDNSTLPNGLDVLIRRSTAGAFSVTPTLTRCL